MRVWIVEARTRYADIICWEFAEVCATEQIARDEADKIKRELKHQTRIWSIPIKEE